MNVKELSEALKPYIYAYGESYAFIIFIFTKHIILTGEVSPENTNALKVNINGEEYLASLAFWVFKEGKNLNCIIPTEEQLIEAKTEKVVDKIEGGC